MKTGEADTYLLSTDHCGPVATEAVVWLSAQVAADYGSELYFYIWSGHCPLYIWSLMGYSCRDHCHCMCVLFLAGHALIHGLARSE